MNVFDLQEIDPLHRDILTYLMRNGATEGAQLALALGHSHPDIERAVKILEANGQVECSDGLIRVLFGKSRRSRALPQRMWDALLPTTRSFSEQDIAALRVAIPMLQFARARMGQFADHGPGHAQRVKSFAVQLGALVSASRDEQQILRVAAMFHDVGNAVNREEHHTISAAAVERLVKSRDLPLSAEEGTLIALLCCWHRGTFDPDRCDTLRGGVIRTGLLAEILRVADAMDIDFRRVDYPDHLRRVVAFFFPDELPYWTSLEPILGLRIHCREDVHLQVFTRAEQSSNENMQISMLRRDLAATALNWSINVATVLPDPPRVTKVTQTVPRALIQFPYEPHSIVMAAISRKHLTKCGYSVDLSCRPSGTTLLSPTTAQDGSQAAHSNYDQLVVLGDPSRLGSSRPTMAAIEGWQKAGTNITWLSRHEGTLELLPELRANNVSVVLGGDWSYFHGENPDLSDLAWARIGALCTRDPGQATLQVSRADEEVMRGLLDEVYGFMEPGQTTTDWTACADSIMKHIEADDRAYFQRRGTNFAARLHFPIQPRMMERILLFESSAPSLPTSTYWALEAAIEEHGRTPDPGISFRIPYAIAVARNDEDAEMLAINHWRDDRTIPVRLLYPIDLGPPPDGHETAVHINLSGRDLDPLLEGLLAACNAAS